MLNFSDMAIKIISRTEFENAGKLWALSVDNGAIVVRKRDNAICFIDLNTKKLYALNGIARMG